MIILNHHVTRSNVFTFCFIRVDRFSCYPPPNAVTLQIAHSPNSIQVCTSCSERFAERLTRHKSVYCSTHNRSTHPYFSSVCHQLVITRRVTDRGRRMLTESLRCVATVTAGNYQVTTTSLVATDAGGGLQAACGHAACPEPVLCGVAWYRSLLSMYGRLPRQFDFRRCGPVR